MNDPLFEWDEDKAASNFRKHQVSFTESATVFNDEFIATMLDPNHSGMEERFIAIGLSVKSRVLVVSYTERGEKTRLISCRKATPAERKQYEKGK